MRRTLFLLALAVAAAACSPTPPEAAPAVSAEPAVPPPVSAPSTTAATVTGPPETGPPPTAPPETVPPETTPPATEAPGAQPPGAPEPPPATQLRVRPIWAFPGPDQFEGDVVTFQIPIGDFDEHELGDVALYVDGERLDANAVLSGDPLLGGYVILPEAYDTTGAAGAHDITIDVTLDGVAKAFTTTLDVAPAASRPLQEADAEWTSVGTECCTVHYVTHSAAARDLDLVVDLVDESAAKVEDLFGAAMPDVDLVLIDVLWGNGGYAGQEVVVSYLDRDFGPRTPDTFEVTLRHEFTHALGDTLERSNVPWPLEEAIAVYATGGHFKEDSLPERAAALDRMGGIVPLDEFFDTFDELQHESRYVQAGALAAYVAEQYGWDGLLDLYSARVRASSDAEWFDRAARRVLGAGLGDIDAGFARWVTSHDPGIEGTDLELTIALQDARRAYQVRHAPYQNFFIYPSVTEVGQPATALREARDPAEVAVESLIAWGQQLIVERRYDEAAAVVAEVEEIVATGTIRDGLAARFLDTARALDGEGLELLDLDPAPRGERIVATRAHPELLQLRRGRDGTIRRLVSDLRSSSPL